jgi:4-hydroxyphenylacetate 3-monooxygenase
MLIGGKEKLERMRDGRAVYIGAERVDDVTRHPAFRHAAQTIADLYDLKADAGRRDLFSFEENGERYGLPWLRCRNRDDLSRRMRAMKAIADATYGMIGRSPDHVAGLITGLATKPELLDALTPGFGTNLMRYYDHARRNDLYLSFAVTPPSGIRSREIFAGEARDDPTLQVIAEHDAGVTISGMKMLATGAVFADEVWIGNLTAIDDKRRSESITCALPIATPGVSFWAREPYERHARHEADYPLSFRFDETDTVLVCDRVKVPWERVFLHNNGAMSRRIYIETPANCYQNQQSNVRFWAKMGLIVGLASRMCQANGVDKIPAVRETLGRLAALEATIGGLVNGQIEACEQWPEGFVTPNRRIVYATLNWCQEHPHRDHRCAAHAGRRGTAADARKHRSRHRSGAQGALRALVVDARLARHRPAQALQAGMGPDRLRIRRPPHALRTFLCGQLDHRAQPERPRGAVGGIPCDCGRTAGARRDAADVAARKSHRGNSKPPTSIGP